MQAEFYQNNVRILQITIKNGQRQVEGDDSWMDWSFKPWSKKLQKEVSYDDSPDEWLRALSALYSGSAMEVRLHDQPHGQVTKSQSEKPPEPPQGTQGRPYQEDYQQAHSSFKKANSKEDISFTECLIPTSIWTILYAIVLFVIVQEMNRFDGRIIITWLVVGIVVFSPIVKLTTGHKFNLWDSFMVAFVGNLGAGVAAGLLLRALELDTPTSLNELLISLLVTVCIQIPILTVFLQLRLNGKIKRQAKKQ